MIPKNKDEAWWPTSLDETEKRIGTTLTMKKENFRHSSEVPNRHEITLSTQCDASRIMRVLNLAKEWQGPVVAAILVVSNQVDSVKKTINAIGGEEAAKYITFQIV